MALPTVRLPPFAAGDDGGGARGSADAREISSRVCKARYEAGLPTLVTSNFLLTRLLDTVVDPGAAGLLVKALAHIAKLWGAYLDPDAANRARLENPDPDHFLSEDMRRRIREAREAVGGEVGS